MTGRTSAISIFPPELGIVVSQQGTTSTIQVEGKWDPAAPDRMRHAVAEALGRGPESVVLDLSRATSMEASGIALVVALAKRCTCQSVRLVIVPGPAEVQRLFQACQGLPFVGGP
ncbi:MAG: STAS domain-containing protein [Actinomycetota bacterium]|nr:STAS domain-containing protein [Actinomycetota bacterium]